MVKYKLSARMNSAFNSFHDLKFPESSKLMFLWAKHGRWIGLLSINKCLLYHKKFDWMQDITSELDAK